MTCRAGTVHPSGAPGFIPSFWCDPCWSCFDFCVYSCVLLFVFLSWHNVFFYHVCESTSRSSWYAIHSKTIQIYILIVNWIVRIVQGPSWSWSYGTWIDNYLCNQCLSPLTLWVRIPLRRGILYITLCDKVCQWLAAGRWFFPVTLISFTNKTDRHDITEILLKVVLNTKTRN